MYVTSSTEHAPFAPRHCDTRSPTKRLKGGSYLFFEGDDVKRLYRVKSGVLRLTRLLEDGRRQVIAFGYPDDIVGFPSGGKHHTDCDALTDTELQPYRRADLETGECDPELHQALLQAALHEISAMQDHFMMLGRKSAAERVASFFCVLADRVGSQIGTQCQINLPMSRTDIADFLGLTTETVSRSITGLRKAGVIALDTVNTVTVLDQGRLRKLSMGEDG